MAITYIIDMGGNRAVATNTKDAIKQGYKWADMGATIWKLANKKMVKFGWVVKQPVAYGDRKKSPITVFYKADRFGNNPISVHSVGMDGAISPKIDVLDEKYIMYFGTDWLVRDDKYAKSFSKEKKQLDALKHLYGRTHNVNRY